MWRFFLLGLLLGLTAGSLVLGQQPSASATAKPPTPTPSASAAPAAPSPTPSTEQLINSLSPADLQAAISLLKANFAKPDAINETDLNRATFQGLMVRLGHGLMVFAEKPGAAIEPAAPFFAEILENHIGYLRLG